MLGKTFAMLALMGLAQSACFNATVDGGMTSAMCTDEDTGYSFDYVDFDGKYPMNQSGPTAEMLDAIYADYLSGISDPSTPPPRRAPISKRVPSTLTGYWEDCHNNAVEGVCADDHVIIWRGSGDYFISKLEHMMHFANGDRMRNNPRAKCTKWDHGGTICLQWAYNVLGAATDAQIKSMAAHTWNHCQSDKYSCQTRFKNGHAQYCQYFCISDRSTGCTTNASIDNCKNIPPPLFP